MQETGVPNLFYTAFAEASKLSFYVILALLVGWGFVQRRRGRAGWAGWVHVAIMLNFMMGVAYSGIRMVTTDATTDMLVRRIFAWEAWFNLACAAFYFLAWWIWDEYKRLRLLRGPGRPPE